MKSFDSRVHSSNTKTKLSLIIYMLMHFCVDFACFYYLFGTFSVYKYTGIGMENGLILYNILAFGLQFIIGRIYDSRKYRSAALIGIFLVMMGLLINAGIPLLVSDSLVVENKRILHIAYKDWLVVILVVLAIGNAFFHVAGGIDSLTNSNGKMGRCGMFIGTGALGVSMGTYVGANQIFDEFTILCFMLIGFAGIFTYGDAVSMNLIKSPSVSKEEGRDKVSFNSVVVLLCLLAIVMRSYVGIIQRLSLSTLFLSALCIGFGKAIGGFLADEFGGKLVGSVAMLISAVCFTGFQTGGLVAVIGFVSFNIAMPITMYTLYEQIPQYPGVVNGLNSLALLVGYVLYVVGVFNPTVNVMVLGTILAMVCILISVPQKRKNTVSKGKCKTVSEN